MNIECPYCGHPSTFYPDCIENEEKECENCEKIYEVIVEIVVSTSALGE